MPSNLAPLAPAQDRHAGRLGAVVADTEPRARITPGNQQCHSRATRAPDKDVSATRHRDSRVKSSTTTRMRNRRPSVSVSDTKSRDHRWFGPYAGIAPVTERSGNKCWVHWRLQCPKFQRQTCVEFAALSIPHCYWAKIYYEQQRARGSSHQAALRALAFKWIRIVHRCWQNRTPYDEAKYLNALKRHGSPLLS